MTTLRYKGYQGSVEYEDGSLVVRVLHIDDLITTNIDRASAAQSEFEKLVEDYLDTCSEIGKEPCKPFKGTFNVRIPPDLHKKVAMLAAEKKLSMNSLVTDALDGYVETQSMDRSNLDHSFIVKVYSRLPSDQSYSAVKTVHAPVLDKKMWAPMRPSVTNKLHH